MDDLEERTEREINSLRVYSKVKDEISRSLIAFRRNYPTKHTAIDEITWEYISLGQGEETLLFLHGMAGAYDIWWQQIDALKGRYRIISVTYPPVDSLGGMARGIMGILTREGVQEANVVGSSLGGYLAQYLVSQFPERVRHAIFANTFPPNELIARRTGVISLLFPVVPEWMIHLVHRLDTHLILFPTSGRSELVRAYMLEGVHKVMSKVQFMARYSCVIDHFTPPDPQVLGIPIMILESDNDPLIAKVLRERLKITYPTATVHTFHAVGHFPYLNHAQAYTEQIERFLLVPHNER